jgi:hypothetical protein
VPPSPASAWGLILRGAAAAIADGRVLRSLYNAISLSFGLQRDERNCNPKQAMDIFQRPDRVFYRRLLQII